jgi:hypothetical protein
MDDDLYQLSHQCDIECFQMEEIVRDQEFYGFNLEEERYERVTEYQ